MSGLLWIVMLMHSNPNCGVWYDKHWKHPHFQCPPYPECCITTGELHKDIGWWCAVYDTEHKCITGFRPSTYGGNLQLDMNGVKCGVNYCEGSVTFDGPEKWLAKPGEEQK